MKRTSALNVTATLAALALAGCGGTVVDGERPRFPEYTSPATVLKAVQISFNHRNIYYLKQSLGPDFTFHFDPRDVGHSPPGGTYIIPESWSHDQLTRAAGEMFQKAYSITLFVRVEPLRRPGENEATYKVERVTMSLLVMVDEVNGIKVDKGYCDFAFERYATEKGEKLWRLSGWWDHTSGSLDEYHGGTPASLGRVLAMYYRE